jgi:hypothetical protein
VENLLSNLLSSGETHGVSKQFCVRGFRIAFLIASAGMFTAGCGLRPQGEAFRPEVVAGDRGVIYVFRDMRRLVNRPLRVFIDQHEVGPLDAGAYHAAAVEPGPHLVRVEGSAEGSREVEVRAGESAYVRIVARRFRPRQPMLEVPDDDRARALIARTSRRAAEPMSGAP